MTLNERIKTKLIERDHSNSLRVLKTVSNVSDFSSNDYLGFANRVISVNEKRSGSGGSRLLTGNNQEIEELENLISRIGESETALFYSSGYAANLGVMSALPQRGDVILYDEFVHASIRDGIRLSHANAFSFKHNDLDHLEKLLIKYRENEVFVVVESIYSMDGDNVDPISIKELKKRFAFNLIVDEAHSFGLSKNDVFQSAFKNIACARIVTFGKAFGSDGAAVLVSNDIKLFLINYSRSFIYSTAPSPHKVEVVKNQIEYWTTMDHVNANSIKLKSIFIDSLKDEFKLISGSQGNIVTLILGDVNLAKYYANALQESNFDVRPILSPTVPKGSERLRFCFHEFNTLNEVNGMISLLRQMKK